MHLVHVIDKCNILGGTSRPSTSPHAGKLLQIRSKLKVRSFWISACEPSEFLPGDCCMKRTRVASSLLNTIVIRLTILAFSLCCVCLAAVAASPSYGLEWPGGGAVRPTLYWDNPCPRDGAPSVFKEMPR